MKSFVVIAGQTCSGKSTLANRLASGICIRQDDWYRDLADIPRNAQGYPNMESPNAFHIDEMLYEIKRLQERGEMNYPIYDIATNQRKGIQRVKTQGGKSVVIEGLHTIELLRHIDGEKIFLDTDIDICKARRVERDSKLFGIPIDVVERHFDENIMPETQRYILPQSKLATIIIRNNDEKEIGRLLNE